jgi:hypothetical protein
MNQTIVTSIFAGLTVWGTQAAVAQESGVESMLLKQSTWLLQSGRDLRVVWFESGPEGGVELVTCPRELKCRAPVAFDNRGFDLGGNIGIRFPSDLASRNVPIFASPGGSVLMPAWVIPTVGVQAGH